MKKETTTETRRKGPSLLLLLLFLSSLIIEATPLALWPIRLGSAALSYAGLVAVLDRPRGDLIVNSDAVRVAPSSVPGAGLGLYATQSMPRGTILGTYPGVVLTLDQNLAKLRQYPWCEAYIWRFSDNKMIIDPTDAMGNIQDYTYGGNPTTPGSLLLCNTILQFFGKPTTLCRINEPPLGRDVNVCTQEDLEKRTITFLLERDVFQSEELFMDYGVNYDRSRYTKDPNNVKVPST
jgi:hypothetical protein